MTLSTQWDAWIDTLCQSGTLQQTILNPLEAAAMSLRQPGDARPACVICLAPYDPATDLCCAFCGANTHLTKALSASPRETTLPALALCCLYGARPYRALERFIPDPDARIACLLHVAAHPMLSTLWSEIIGAALPPAPVATDVWPWPFPYMSRENTVLTRYAPDTILTLFRRQERSAVDTFRKARWGTEDGQVLVTCPKCGTRAWFHHRRKQSHTVRWRCKDAVDRTHESMRRPRRTDVIRPRVASAGCGYAFYDTTNTIFAEDRSWIKLSDILPMLFYGEAYLPILATDVSPAVLHRLVERFLSYDHTEQPLVARLYLHVQRWVPLTALIATESFTEAQTGH